MNASRMVSAALLAAMLVGCGASGRASESDDASEADDAAAPAAPFDPAALAGREWRLVALPGSAEVPVPPDARAVLRFEAQPDGSWQASGFGPCNQLASPVALTGDTLEFTRLGSTKRACAELALETAWFERLRGGAATAKLDGDRLELVRDGVAVMVFEAGPAE